MGKRGGQQKSQVLNSGHRCNLTLRQENSGRKQIKGGSNNAKSMLKLQHLRKLAVWACGEASMPSMGAFLGHRFAGYGEDIGVAPDPSLFPCQRCESILQPGFNCTVRIEKNKSKTRRRSKKPNNSTQNNVVYKCHFCSHSNLKRGTPKGHLMEIYPPKAQPTLKSALTIDSKKVLKVIADANHSDDSVISVVAIEPKMVLEIKANTNHADETDSPEKASDAPLINSQATPLVRLGLTLLDRNIRKRNKSTSKKQPEKTDPEKGDGTWSKRRRKSWTSLKEIAEKNRHHEINMDITNLSIPLFL